MPNRPLASKHHALARGSRPAVHLQAVRLAAPASHIKPTANYSQPAEERPVAPVDSLWPGPWTTKVRARPVIGLLRVRTSSRIGGSELQLTIVAAVSVTQLHLR